MRSAVAAGVLLAGVMGCTGTGGNQGAKRPSEETAVRVYRVVQPCVVGLACADNSGTGIVLTADGLILTNAHVVISPLPYHCTVDVGDGDDARQVTFKNVERVGFHPHDDLALVRIHPEEQGVTLKPAVINHVKGEPGQKIFVIGNPGDGAHILRKTITSGIISAVDRNSNGDRCYQIDAAINPGNSGGPICDRDAKVLALVSSSATGLQGIGYALPLQDLDTHAFVDVMQHKPDPAAAQAFLTGAEQRMALVNAAAKDGVDSASYNAAAANAMRAYFDALTWNPANADLYAEMGDIEVALNRIPDAGAYYLRYLRMRPWDGQGARFFNQLGNSLGASKLYPAQALAYEEGLAKFPWSAHLWESMASHHARNKKPEDAAYCASVALFLGVKDDRVAAMKKVVTQSLKNLSADERSKFAARVTNAAILAALDKMMEQSNAARRRHDLYMTPAFGDYVAKTDGPPLPDTAAQIPQEPLTRPERFVEKPK